LESRQKGGGMGNLVTSKSTERTIGKAQVSENQRPFSKRMKKKKNGYLGFRRPHTKEGIFQQEYVKGSIRRFFDQDQGTPSLRERGHNRPRATCQRKNKTKKTSGWGLSGTGGKHHRKIKAKRTQPYHAKGTASIAEEKQAEPSRENKKKRDEKKRREIKGARWRRNACRIVQ